MMPFKRSFMLILLGGGLLLSELLRPLRVKQNTGVRAHDRYAENDPSVDSTEKANDIQRNSYHSCPHSMSSRREVHEPHAANHDSSTQSCKTKKHWLDHAVFWASIIAAVGAVTAAVYTGQQAGIAQEELQASHRPWVSVDISIAGDWEYGPEAATFSVDYRTKNHGPTPAVEVYISSTTFLFRPRIEAQLLAEQNKICEMGKTYPHMGARSVGMLFPGQERIEHFGYRLGKVGIDKSLEAFVHIDKNYSFIAPLFIGCVSYRFTFDDTIHKTPFIVQLGLQDPNDRIALHGIDTKIRKIEANLLGVKPLAFSEGEEWARQQKPD